MHRQYVSTVCELAGCRCERLRERDKTMTRPSDVSPDPRRRRETGRPQLEDSSRRRTDGRGAGESSVRLRIEAPVCHEAEVEGLS